MRAREDGVVDVNVVCLFQLGANAPSGTGKDANIIRGREYDFLSRFSVGFAWVVSAADGDE